MLMAFVARSHKINWTTVGFEMILNNSELLLLF